MCDDVETIYAGVRRCVMVLNVPCTYGSCLLEKKNTKDTVKHADTLTHTLTLSLSLSLSLACSLARSLTHIHRHTH